MESRIQNVAFFRKSVNCSVAHFTNRSYVIFEVNRFIEFSFVRFCSLRIGVWSGPRAYCVGGACSEASGNASLGEFQESAAMTVTRFNRSRIYRVGGACAEVSGNASLGERARELQDSPLGELGSASSGEFARKLQASWYLLWAGGAGRRHRRMLWGSVEKYSFRSGRCARVSWYNLTKEGLVRFYWV